MGCGGHDKVAARLGFDDAVDGTRAVRHDSPGRLRGQTPADRNAADLAAFLVTSLQGLRIMGAITPDRVALLRTAEVALSCSV